MGDRVITGAHHIAGEQRDLGGHALRNAPQRQVGARNEQLLGLGPLQVPQFGAVPERASEHTAVIVAPDTGDACAAGRVKAAEHAIADGGALDVVAYGEHRADELVADREAGLDRDAAVVDVKIRAADAARLDPDDRVLGMLQLGLGDLLHEHLARSLEGDGAHRAPTIDERGACGAPADRSGSAGAPASLMLRGCPSPRRRF